jgi:hypothetical protein
MANSYVKAERLAPFALGLLEREIVLPALVWRDAGGSFKGAAGDTISIRVPARTVARTRTLRGARPQASEGNGIITMDELTEFKVDVTLDEDLYSAIAITDEEIALDITDFGAQILAPQVRAVAEALENKLAAEMVAAPWTSANSVTIPFGKLAGDTATYNSADYDVHRGLVEARRILNVNNIPQNDRVIVVGSGMEAAFLNDPHLNRFDGSGDSGPGSALRDATLGRIAGFNQVIVSNALPPMVGFAFHRTAFVLSMQAPSVPAGASSGSAQSYQGLAMRVLRDYDLRNLQDRQVVDVYAGTNHVADGDSGEVQTVTVTGTPTGGSFTLTANGQTTAAIAYNASAAAVRTALNALSGVNVSATGGALPGTAVVVTFNEPDFNVAQMTAAASLTGGTTPAVTVTTTTAGDPTFVRAVKLVLA